MATAPKPQPLPERITRHAELQAQLAGITPEQWLAQMAALRLDTDEGSHEYLRRRAAGADPAAWKTLLTQIPNTPPLPGDELD